MAAALTACGKSTEKKTDAAFKPALDTNTGCSITVAGSYDNFEALETEFDRFNEIYPQVQLSYVKLDDYNNVLGTALESNDKPNIFFSHASMIGNEKYASVTAHMEELSDAARWRKRSSCIFLTSTATPMTPVSSGEPYSRPCPACSRRSKHRHSAS